MAGRTRWWGQGPRDGGLLEGSGLTAVGYFYPPSFSIAFRGNVDADRTAQFPRKQGDGPQNLQHLSSCGAKEEQPWIPSPPACPLRPSTLAKPRTGRLWLFSFSCTCLASTTDHFLPLICAPRYPALKQICLPLSQMSPAATGGLIPTLCGKNFSKVLLQRLSRLFCQHLLTLHFLFNSLQCHFPLFHATILLSLPNPSDASLSAGYWTLVSI